MSSGIQCRPAAAMCDFRPWAAGVQLATGLCTSARAWPVPLQHNPITSYLVTLLPPSSAHTHTHTHPTHPHQHPAHPILAVRSVIRDMRWMFLFVILVTWAFGSAFHIVFRWVLGGRLIFWRPGHLGLEQHIHNKLES